MNDIHPDLLFSESVEMYLLRIALLSQVEQPVPIARLADELGISAVSTNQMCRKLEEKDLVTYQPYKGVMLTANGEAIADQILEKRRLWQEFMINALGMTTAEAEDYACRFEHVTTDEVSHRLAIFLSKFGQTTAHSLAASMAPQQPLNTLQAGQSVEIVRVDSPQPLLTFLTAEGLFPGALIKVLAVSSHGAYLLEVADHQLSIAAEIAADIQVMQPAEKP